jgi:hypothetical protein
MKQSLPEHKSAGGRRKPPGARAHTIGLISDVHAAAMVLALVGGGWRAWKTSRAM